MGERSVRIRKVMGSNPTGSTKKVIAALAVMAFSFTVGFESPLRKPFGERFSGRRAAKRFKFCSDSRKSNTTVKQPNIYPPGPPKKSLQL